MDVADKLSKATGYKIMLSHFPSNMSESFRGKDIDLVLSGHMHGGQVRIKDNGVYVPGYGLFPEYTEGRYTFSSSVLIISSGLGDHTILPRINNSHQLVIVNIRKTK